jgi:hypothetical protein
MRKYTESITLPAQGTIIDIESIGDFNNHYPDDDSRQYSDIQPVIFGYLSEENLVIYCAENEDEISLLIQQIKDEFQQLSSPYYAFNSRFERGVLFHSCDMTINFDCELNMMSREKKKYTVQNLGIDNYDDPFFDNGYLCLVAWQNGNFESAITHNRSCLLKERDILIKRGYRAPDLMRFNS